MWTARMSPDVSGTIIGWSYRFSSDGPITHVEQIPRIYVGKGETINIEDESVSGIVAMFRTENGYYYLVFNKQ